MKRFPSTGGVREMVSRATVATASGPVPGKLPINYALISGMASWYGEAEEEGPDSNERLLLDIIKPYAGWITDDSRWPYCSAGLNVVAKAAGHPGTDNVVLEEWFKTPTPALARSWLQAPMSMEILAWEDAIPGDVIVLERGVSPFSGHVGLFVRWDDDTSGVWVWGFNQGNRNSIDLFNSKVLGIRRLFL